jgi:pimeloyl-ACP methyl ester carboxylesterase
MFENAELDRRQFVSSAVLTLEFVSSAVLTLGLLRLPSEVLTRDDRPKSEIMSAKSAKPIAWLDDVKQIDAGLLNVGYADVGPANGPVVVLLHGWPYDIQSYAEVVPLLTARGYRVVVPYLRGYGTTRFRSPDVTRNGQQAALAADVIDLMDALHIQQAIVGGFDWGSRTAAIVGALWPERCKGLVCVSGYLIVDREGNRQPLPPRAELGWWYQYYFATERGRLGYEKNRFEFNKLIWQLASPAWQFDDATFARTARSFENADHVAIVIDNYRWRLGLSRGEPRYDEAERKLSRAPAIGVPAITIASDFDGAAADGAAYAKRFVARYEHRVLKGIGHNVPQEAPAAFAQAIADLDSR